MNSFKKELSYIDKQIKDNRKNSEELTERKIFITNEKTSTTLSLYEIEKEIAGYKVMKRKKRNLENFSKKTEHKKIISLLAFIIIEGTLLLSMGVNVVFIISLITGVGLKALTDCYYNHNLSIQSKECKRACKDMSLEEINKKQAHKSKEYDFKNEQINSYNLEIKKITESIEKNNVEYIELKRQYDIVLNCYQEFLNGVDPKIDDDTLENLLNEEHKRVLPVMAKKLYNKNND